MEVKVSMAHLLTQLQQKIATRLQNKYHPESLENQAVWKSKNQEFKEATFFPLVGGTDTWRCTERHGYAEMYNEMQR